MAFSGFTPAGAPKEIPKAIAARASEIHAAGQPFRIGVITGASTGHSLDGALARADAILFRTPYQNDPDLRKSINEGRTKFFDMHSVAVAPGRSLRLSRPGPLGRDRSLRCHSPPAKLP